MRDRRRLEVGIALRGDALELAQRLDLLQPGVEIARVGAAGGCSGLGRRRAPVAVNGADLDAHVHLSLPYCSVGAPTDAAEVWSEVILTVATRTMTGLPTAQRVPACAQ